MLKIMIAEDESLERKALRYLLEKYYKNNLEIVAEASNGREAVDFAINLKPDIILMDIKMPMLDGLEAGKIIKSELSETEIVILTAFNYFEYAKESIKIGVADYLLKPYSNEEFTDIIDSLLNKFYIKKLLKNKNEQIEKKYAELLSLAEKEIILNLIYSHKPEEVQIEEYKKILNITNNRYCCLICLLKDDLKDESVEIIKDELKCFFNEVIGGVNKNEAVFLIFDDNIDKKLNKEIFKKIFDKKDIFLSFAIGMIEDDLKNFYLSYKKAKRDLCENEALNEEKEDTFQKNNHVYNKLLRSIIDNDINRFNIVFEELILLRFNSNDCYEINQYKIFISEIYEYLITNIPNYFKKNLNKDEILIFNEEINKMNKIEDVTLLLKEKIKNLIILFKRIKESDNFGVIEKAKNYIEENYMKDITLERVANYVSMSSSHFSRIFYEAEGINFKDYLIKIRMEKAINMLLKGNKSIKEIAQEVGYPDQNYFSKAFKKYTNSAPTEYFKKIIN
ncbi:response regulator [Caloramator sp. E03]|uniref:response regulator n=1 Tax=Caloramator sp. E03 TaxID=2576307 RepID=UPI00111000DF|nr:response regulator [Caloramator sp. E03]QCX32895.1 response regulator [Caloramator sp. E03]